MIRDYYTSASALIDGGWRPEDREQLMVEYDLTEEEAEDLVVTMAKILEVHP